MHTNNNGKTMLQLLKTKKCKFFPSYDSEQKISLKVSARVIGTLEAERGYRFEYNGKSKSKTIFRYTVRATYKGNLLIKDFEVYGQFSDASAKNNYCIYGETYETSKAAKKAAMEWLSLELVRIEKAQ